MATPEGGAGLTARLRAIDPQIKLVFGAVALLGIAYGATTSVLAIHLDARGLGKTAIGGLATFFAAGIAAMSLPAGWLVRKVGARLVLLGALAVYLACVLVFPHLSTFGPIAASRLFDGAASVCVWVACETILLARAGDRDKALVTSLYAMCFGVGYVVGPLVAKPIVAVTHSTTLAFRAAAVLAVLSILVASRVSPVAAAEASHESGGSGKSALSILWRIKNSCFATFGYGYFQASVVLFLPIYLKDDKGVSESNTVLVTAFFAAGMLLFSAQAGRLGDRLGHLRVMRALALVGLVMIASFVWLDAFWIMCVAVFVAGATLASISPVSLALQGHVVDKADLARANAIYNVFYAAGMLVGPPLSSALFAWRGGPAMLYHLAGLWAAFALFTMVFRKDDPRAAAP